MAILLSILAIVVTGVAVLVAWRAKRAAHSLALEMVQLRDRLSRAELAREAAEERAESAPAGGPSDPELRERLAGVEARLQEALERERAVVPEGEIDVRDEISRHLRRQGYHRIAFLDSAADGSVLVEAERHGSTTKGRAAIGPDGHVRLKSVSSVRAFP